MPRSTGRLDPAKEDAQKGYFTGTFDAMETWIGGGRCQSFGNFIGKNAGDWFNLPNQGIVRTGVADSHTHRRMLTQPGIPRTMVASSVTDLAALDPEVHSATVNAGKELGTNGPMVRVVVKALASSDAASLELSDPTVVSGPDGDFDLPRVSFIVSSPSGAFLDQVGGPLD